MGHVRFIIVQAHDFVHVGQHEHVLVLVEVPELAGSISHLDEGGIARDAEALLE